MTARARVPMTPARAGVASSFTIVKGTLIDETYSILAAWRFEHSKRENLAHLRATNYIGASSASWLEFVARVMNRRFDPEGRDRALTLLAKSGCALDEWKPILLWHITRDEFLLRDFLENWLFPAFEAGALRVRPADLDEHLRKMQKRGGTVESEWTDTTRRRVAAGLLKAAADFGLLRGKRIKEMGSYHLPERSFLYLLHAIRDEQRSPAKVIGASAWRMFLMHPDDVEREMLRLHQFRKLDYQVAGSLVELTLPCGTSREYAERMVA